MCSSSNPKDDNSSNDKQAIERRASAMTHALHPHLEPVTPVKSFARFSTPAALKCSGTLQGSSTLRAEALRHVLSIVFPSRSIHGHGTILAALLFTDAGPWQDLLGPLASQNDKMKARALSQASLRLSNIGEKQAALCGYLALLHVHINPTLAAAVFELRSLLGDGGIAKDRRSHHLRRNLFMSATHFRSCYFPTGDVCRPASRGYTHTRPSRVQMSPYRSGSLAPSPPPIVARGQDCDPLCVSQVAKAVG